MKDRIKDYFAFNRKEQRGLIILLGLLLLSVLINLFLPQLVPEKEYDIAPFQIAVSTFIASIDKLDSTEKIKPQKFSDNYSKDEGADLSSFIASPFNFDPNDLNEQQWVNMGIGAKIARNILRYREKGGTFRDKKGLGRIYGMNDSVFAILEPYVRIKEMEKAPSSSYINNNDNKNYTKPGNNFTKYKPDTLIIELNSTDSASLLACHGIGPSYAGRIIRYRELLGGFTSVEQLMEIRGMDSIRYNQFRGQITVNPQQVRKIDLNSVTFKELLRHPYFEYYLVKAVFNFKDEIKAYDSVGQIRTIPVMYEELYEKIAPYLDVKPSAGK
ncbi:MAG: helix-hairpin-helix domain-containing protein [Bacteroidales bacterium]|nr:helix-hairpin-helix domain-containing protein [Bacteroidales bacterium]